MEPGYILVLKREDLVKNIPGEEIPIPEGFVVSVDPVYDAEQKRLEEIRQLEQDLLQINEPSIEELSEWGKMQHPYYELKRKLEELNGTYN